MYRFLCCEEVWSPVCRRFVTLLFMQAGDYMQSNCPPAPPRHPSHVMTVTVRHHADHTDRRWQLCRDKSKLKCLFTFTNVNFTLC